MNRAWSPGRSTRWTVASRFPEGGSYENQARGAYRDRGGLVEGIHGSVAGYVRDRCGVRGADRPDAAGDAAGGRDLSGAVGGSGAGVWGLQVDQGEGDRVV